MGASSREKSSAAGAKKSKSSLQSLPGKLQKREKTQGSIDQPARIAALERSLAASSDLNPLVDLLSLLEPPETPKTIHAAAFALHRTFGTLARQGKLATGDADSTAASKTVKDWLRARLGDFGDSLSRLLQHSEPSIRTMALDMLIQLIHLDTEAQSTSTFHFADALNRKLVHGLLIAEDVPQEIRIEFLRRHLPPKKNDDVRYYFFREAAATVNAAKASNVADNLLSILEIYDLTLPSSPSTSAANKKQDHASPLTLQKAYQSAWQALLPRLTNQDQVKRVLSVFHKLVLPNLPKPNLFLDFFVYCCDLGGTVALLALNGLFTLITKHNLDYPAFYTKLYGLLDRQVLHVRYRARFLRMLDLFLSSSHLPVHLVASFIKRLSRLSLTAPPAAIVSVIPFIYNLFKRHPQTVCLIHQPYDEETRNQQTNDPYLPNEIDPLKTQAIDSSVWELASLSSHYLASVSGLAKVFHQQLTKPNYDLEDFLDHTYASMFDTEMGRKVKNAPALDLPPPRAKKVSFFPLQDHAPTQEEQLIWSDPVTELWSF